MDALIQFGDSIIQVLSAVYTLVISTGALVLPWTPLIAWIAFWLLAVDWEKLRPQMVKGGFLGVLLLAFVMIMVWGNVAPPAGGSHNILGLRLSNFVGKTVYVTMLVSMIFLCGSAQLSGAVDRFISFPEDEPEPDHGHAHH